MVEQPNLSENMDEQPNLSENREKQLEEKLFFNVGIRLTKYFQWRIWYIPATLALFVSVISFLGFQSWVKSIANDVVQEEAGSYLDSVVIRMDRLVAESDSIVENQKTMVSYYNNQFNVIMRQYEFFLPFFSRNHQTLRDIYDPGPDIKEMYDSLKQDEGIRIVLEKMGATDKFVTYIYRKEQVHLIFEIPTSLIILKQNEIKNVPFLAKVPIPVSDSLLSILRVEAKYPNISRASIDIQMLVFALFGEDKLLTMEMSFIRK